VACRSLIRCVVQALWLVALWAAGPAGAAPSLWRLPGPFVDEYGQAVQLSQWSGESTIVAMEYAQCRFICSTAWRKLVELQAEADKRGLPLKFLVVSIDPANDTPAGWRDYRKMRNLARDNWRFVTGDRASTDRVAAWLGIKWWWYDGHVMHDFRIVRLNAQGEIVQATNAYDLNPALFFGPPSPL